MVVFDDSVSKDHQDLVYKGDGGMGKAYSNIRKYVDMCRSEIDLQQEDEQGVGESNSTSWYLLDWMPVH